ncbi:MAG TPA: haloacid dehalogenase [Gammaproteobacteria bacterium]|nr:haloacid dehalogenase [Gammaproteobacteria bacterium]|tara:strand:- start:3821 stop:4489 length:669 start_codon:yes stop_codon:yes gene_type:complete
MQIPNLSDISTLLLDMDGTLLDLNFDNYFWNHYLHQRYAEIHDMPGDEARTHVHETLAREHGNLNWYCTDHWSSEFEVDILALKKEVTHLIQYREGALQFLQHLESMHLDVILVTNAHHDVIALKHQHTGLLDLLPDMISSHDYGVPKERTRFWHQLIKDRNLNQPTTMLIDDNVDVLEAAQQSGIAYQLCIGKPDSRRDITPVTQFPVMDDLSELTESALS